MKHTIKIVLIAGLALLNNVMVYAQGKSQGSIEYEITYSTQKMLNEVQKKLIGNLPATISRYMVYVYNGDYAKTTEVMSKINPSLELGTKFNQKGIKYLNIKDNQIYDLAKVKDDFYLINDYTKSMYEKELASEKIDSTINTETKDILGFTCRKIKRNTVSGDEIIWYTTEIPSNGGPFGLFKNGMILAIESEKFSAIATYVEFEKVDITDVKPSDHFPIISYEEYLKLSESKK